MFTSEKLLLVIRPRQIAATERILNRIEVLEICKTYDYVIRQADGSIYNPNSINSIIRKMTDKIGLPPCRVHDYRHALASLLFESGTPLADVTIQLGHGQTRTTECIYIHRSNIAKAENVKALSNAISISL